jgi:hypothetical protein
MLQNDSVKPGTKDTNQARTARAVRALSVAAALGNNRLYSTPPPRARSRGRTPPRPQRPGTPGDAGGAAWRASSRAPAPANVPPTPAGCARGLAPPPCAPPRGDSTRADVAAAPAPAPGAMPASMYPPPSTSAAERRAAPFVSARGVPEGSARACWGSASGAGACASGARVARSSRYLRSMSRSCARSTRRG